MRFAAVISLILAGSSFAAAQPGQTYTLGGDVKTPPVSLPVTFQNRAGGSVPQTISGLAVDSLATGLGHITAIAYAPDGAIFVADTEKGRVIRLEDRGRDGRIDGRRVVTEGLEHLASMAVLGNSLYMSDQQAVWKIPVSGGPRTEFVSLRNTQADTQHRPLLSDPHNNRLLIGLNTGANAKVIAVDIESRQASLLTSGPGEITALAKPAQGPIWAGLSGALVPVIQGQALSRDRGQQLETGVSISALIVPGQYDTFEGWPEMMKDKIIAAQISPVRMPRRSSGGFNVVTIPTVFGQPQAELSVLMDGFITSGGRSAWGIPAALAMDSRGLLLADPESGTLWRVKKEEPAAVITPVPKAPKAPEKPKAVAQKKPDKAKTTLGSRIEEGSQIESASSLTLGSTIVRDYDKKEDEDTAEQPPN